MQGYKRDLLICQGRPQGVHTPLTEQKQVPLSLHSKKLICCADTVNPLNGVEYLADNIKKAPLRGLISIGIES